MEVKFNRAQMKQERAYLECHNTRPLADVISPNPLHDPAMTNEKATTHRLSPAPPVFASPLCHC